MKEVEEMKEEDASFSLSIHRPGTRELHMLNTYTGAGFPKSSVCGPFGCIRADNNEKLMVWIKGGGNITQII